MPLQALPEFRVPIAPDFHGPNIPDFGAIMQRNRMNQLSMEEKQQLMALREQLMARQSQQMGRQADLDAMQQADQEVVPQLSITPKGDVTAGTTPAGSFGEDSPEAPRAIPLTFLPRGGTYDPSAKIRLPQEAKTADMNRKIDVQQSKPLKLANGGVAVYDPELSQYVMEIDPQVKPGRETTEDYATRQKAWLQARKELADHNEKLRLERPGKTHVDGSKTWVMEKRVDADGNEVRERMTTDEYARRHPDIAVPDASEIARDVLTPTSKLTPDVATPPAPDEDANSVREAYRAGKISREQAAEKLKALGMK